MYFDRLISKWSDFTGRIVSFAIVAIMAILMYEVAARHFFNAPTKWAHEASGLIFVGWFMLGGSYLLFRRGHVSIDILYSRLSHRARAITDIITTLVIAFVSWIFIWYASQAAWKSLKLGERSLSPWAPPLYPIKMLVVLAVFMLMLQAFANIISHVKEANRIGKTR